MIKAASRDKSYQMCFYFGAACFCNLINSQSALVSRSARCLLCVPLLLIVVMKTLQKPHGLEVRGRADLEMAKGLNIYT